jgi:hypothetical protein
MNNRVRYKKPMRSHKRSIDSILKEIYLADIADVLYTSSVLLYRITKA